MLNSPLVEPFSLLKTHFELESFISNKDLLVLCFLMAILLRHFNTTREIFNFIDYVLINTFLNKFPLPVCIVKYFWANIDKHNIAAPTVTFKIVSLVFSVFHRIPLIEAVSIIYAS